MIHRSAMLLRLITANNRLGMRLVDLHVQAELSRPTAHRILQALVSELLVRQDGHSKRYFLGSQTYEMGLAAAPAFDLRDICQPFLQQVAQQSGDTVFLTTRSGFDGVCLARAEGAYPIKAFVLDIGRRRPLQIGGGALAMLSGFANDEIERIWQANRERVLRQYPGFDVDAMWRRIHQTRMKGYLLNDVLEVDGVSSLAVPILGLGNMPVGAISISALRIRLSDGLIDDKVTMLQNAVAEIQNLIAQQ